MSTLANLYAWLPRVEVVHNQRPFNVLYILDWESYFLVLCGLLVRFRMGVCRVPKEKLDILSGHRRYRDGYHGCAITCPEFILDVAHD